MLSCFGMTMRQRVHSQYSSRNAGVLRHSAAEIASPAFARASRKAECTSAAPTGSLDAAVSARREEAVVVCTSGAPCAACMAPRPSKSSPSDGLERTAKRPPSNDEGDGVMEVGVTMAPSVGAARSGVDGALPERCPAGKPAAGVSIARTAREKAAPAGTVKRAREKKVEPESETEEMARLQRKRGARRHHVPK